MKMKLRCKLFGHDPAPAHDTGFEVCERCGLHESYHHAVYHNAGILLAPFRRLAYFLRHEFRLVTRCSHCRKLDSVCGAHVGNHENCPPF